MGGSVLGLILSGETRDEEDGGSTWVDGLLAGVGWGLGTVGLGTVGLEWPRDGLVERGSMATGYRWSQSLPSP